MICSKVVSANFSRTAENYDQYADFQKYVAEKLSEKIFASGNFVKGPKKILELGCGTGFLTRKIFDIFPDSNFIITDISETMLGFCRRKTGKQRKEKNISAKFAVCNVEKELPGGSFDMIFSSLTLQWVSDMRAAFERIRKRLSSDSVFFFTTLAEPTFESLKSSFSDLKVAYPGPKLATAGEIEDALSIFRKTAIESEVYRKKYPSTLEFLRHLQMTGAGNPTGIPLSCAKLRNIISRHDEKFLPVEGAISAEYHLFFGICRR